MEYSNRNGLTNDTRPTAPEAQFFLAPESPLQRQYEALRCFFVEGLPSQQVATRFGYSPGAFRVLCHQFRHDLSKRARFFQAIRRGPQAAPARDRVRERAVALRKRNLSVYDIQRELAAAGHSISRRANLRLMGAWFEQVQAAGLPRGSSFDLDFHTVPANSQQEPLDKHYVSSRSRSQKASSFFWLGTPPSVSYATPMRVSPGPIEPTRCNASSSSGTNTAVSLRPNSSSIPS